MFTLLSGCILEHGNHSYPISMLYPSSYFKFQNQSGCINLWFSSFGFFVDLDRFCDRMGGFKDFWFR